jgi:glycerol-3-phosphate acyltransferase PlsY
MNLLVSAAFGYLLGSVPFAVIVSRAFRLADPRSFGSGNPGATNVLRSGSKSAALLTLLGDAAKGWLAMFIAKRAGAGEHGRLPWRASPPLSATFSPSRCAFAAARAWRPHWECCSVSLAHVAGSVAALWLTVVIFTRYSSVAALAAAAAAPFAHLVDLGNAAKPRWLSTLMCVVLVYRHKSNIRKLIAGTEGRVGGRKQE